MTKIYFVRHCTPNFENKNDRERELTKDGLAARKYIVDYLKDKSIDVIFSSTYKRCIDTIKPFSELTGLPINTAENFKERNIGKWVDDFATYSANQWKDFSYKIEGGESLQDVQIRNIIELKRILKENKNQNIVISTHGTAFSTILNYYDSSFCYDSFNKIKSIMPFIASTEFSNDNMNRYQILNPCNNNVIIEMI